MKPPWIRLPLARCLTSPLRTAASQMHYYYIRYIITTPLRYVYGYLSDEHYLRMSIKTRIFHYSPRNVSNFLHLLRISEFSIQKCVRRSTPVWSRLYWLLLIDVV